MDSGTPVMDSSGEGVADTTSSSEETPVVREFKIGALAGRHLVIGVPSHTGKSPMEWIGETVSLTRTLQTAGAKLELRSANKCGHVHWARDALMTWFLADPETTDYLSIDHDIKWTANNALRLMLLGGGSSSGKDVVCGFYGSKEDSPTLYAVFDLDKDGNPIRCPETGFYRLTRAATGFMLIKRHVADAVAAAAPKYRHERDPIEHAAIFNTRIDENGYALTEDYAFCDDVRACGFSIWGDPGVRLVHIGEKDFLPPLPNIED